MYNQCFYHHTFTMNIPIQKTAAGAFIFLILFVTPASSTPVSKDIPDFAVCDANSTVCSIGEFCLDGFCESCVPCESRGREPPPPTDGNICAEKEGDCGPCLPGHKEEDMTKGSRKGKCSPMESYSNSFRDVANVLGVVAFAIIIVALIIVLAIAGAVWLFRNRLRKICSSCRKPESRNSDSNQVNPDGGNLSNGHVQSETNGIHSTDV